MEELENLEETLNDSIRESIGARAGKIFRGKKIGATEDNEEYMRYFTHGKYSFSNRKFKINLVPLCLYSFLFFPNI